MPFAAFAPDDATRAGVVADPLATTTVLDVAVAPAAASSAASSAGRAC